MAFKINIKKLRCCAHCGYWEIGYSNIFCNECESGLLSQIFIRQNQKAKHFQHFYLLDWFKNDNGSIVHSLIYALKNGEIIEVFSWLSEQFFKSEIGSIYKRPVFIPAPSKYGYADHAMEWAQALAGSYQGQYLDLFLRTNVREQKRKNIQERKKSNIIINPIYEEYYLEYLDDFSHVVFVDDLLTTGATAENAYGYLNEIGNFTCLTVAYRPRDPSL
jgi:predicted amidophosphoribosyltransferase